MVSFNYLSYTKVVRNHDLKSYTAMLNISNETQILFCQNMLFSIIGVYCTKTNRKFSFIH
jgi:hypothetical protein